MNRSLSWLAVMLLGLGAVAEAPLASEPKTLAGEASAQATGAAVPTTLDSKTTSEAASRAEPPATAQAVLNEAFRNRYDLSFTAEIEMVLEVDGAEVRRRRLQAATLLGDGDYRAIGQVQEPEYLRGMTLLSLSEDEGGHQAFVYLPSIKRIRRISFTHRDDAFLGSDLTYEDFERRRVSDYAVDGMREGSMDGEPIYIVECRPTTELRYQRAEFSIAKSDSAILEIREYKDDEPEAFRRMKAPRAGMQDLDGHIIATRMSIENLERNTSTQVAFSDLQARALDRRLFTSGALERRSSLRAAMGCKGKSCE